jgi:hypothetical protein
VGVPIHHYWVKDGNFLEIAPDSILEALIDRRLRENNPTYGTSASWRY